MNKKEFSKIIGGANWCSKGILCDADNGNECPLCHEKRNCCEIFAKFILQYEKEIRENTHFCEHCGSLIEEGDNDD